MSKDGHSATGLKYGIKICCELKNLCRNSRPVSALRMQDLFVFLSHKFESNVHAGLFLSRFPDSVVRMNEHNFYSLWQEEKGWTTASADMAE